MPDHERHVRPLMTRLRDRLAVGASARYDAGADAIVSSPGGLRVRLVPLDAIVRIEAGNRDTVRDETVCLFFHLHGEPPLAVAEPERGFGKLVDDLASRFPGIRGWQAAIPPVAFQLTSVDLWRRDEPGPPVAGPTEPS